MQPVKIVVWDSIGNVLLGVRPSQSWTPLVRSRLLAEDPDAPAHAPSFAKLFADHAVDLLWFRNAGADPSAFDGLPGDFAASLRTLTAIKDLAAAIEDADFLVIHKERLPAEALLRARRLRLIQHLGQDYRGVPVETARAMGVPVAATPLVNYLAVAEHVWAVVLNHLKRLPEQRTHMEGRAYAETWGLFPGLQLARDQTLGLLGFGEIARPVARIARAFEMPTIYWDVVRFPELEERYGVAFSDRDDLFRRADVLSVHLALNEHTVGIVGAREIGLMKAGALFVNTARGKLVDQAALVRALAEGWLGGAALDVYAEEPLPADDPLLALHARPDARVTLTPHSAWQSPWTWVRDSHGIWSNVLRVLRGEPALHLV